VNGRQKRKYAFVAIEDVNNKSKAKMKNRKTTINNMKIKKEGVIYDRKFCDNFHLSYKLYVIT
jgi:hypothetical protein